MPVLQSAVHSGVDQDRGGGVGVEGQGEVLLNLE